MPYRLLAWVLLFQIWSLWLPGWMLNSTTLTFVLYHCWNHKNWKFNLWLFNEACEGISTHAASEGKSFVVQLLSRVQLFATPWTAACQASLSFTVSRSLLKFMSIELVMPSNHLILCCPSPALHVSHHQGLFQWISSLLQVADALELQRQSFQWIFRGDIL